jgi:hypothetical protein
MRVARWLVMASAGVIMLGACGTSAPTSVGTPAAPTSPVHLSPSSTPSASGQPRPVPDAASIARVLLAMPHRPGFLDPFGSQIGGRALGLGPELRIAGYRAEPLFVCVQHVDMRAGTAGAWTAYAVDATGGVSESGASAGHCPTAPGRAVVKE